MGIVLTDILEKGFVGAGIADGNDLYNAVNIISWNRETNTLRWTQRDADGAEVQEVADLSYLVNAASGEAVTANVAAWAQADNEDTIPLNKLSDGTDAAKGIVQLTASSTPDTNTALAATPAYVRALINAIPSPSTGLNQAQVDGRVSFGVQVWARRANTDVIPGAKLFAATTSVRGALKSTDGLSAIAGLLADAAVTPVSLAYVFENRTATATRWGTVRLATDAEARAGTATDKVMTPANVKAYVDSRGGSSAGTTPVAAPPLEVLPAKPTDLTQYVNTQVLRTPDAWWEVDHESTDDLSTIFTAAAVQSLGNFGVNIVSGGNGFLAQATGAILNFERLASLTIATSPVGAIYLEPAGGQPSVTGSTGRLVVLIRQSAVQGITQLYVRFYNGSATEAATRQTIDIRSGETLTLNGVVWRVFRSQIDEYGTGIWGNVVRFFSPDVNGDGPAVDDQETNEFEIFRGAGKFLKEIDPPYVPAVPTTDVDVSHGLDFVVFETDGPTARTYNFALQKDVDNDFIARTAPVVGEATANIRYYRQAHGTAADRGRWSIVFSTATDPFAKTVDKFRWQVGSGTVHTVALREDTGITGAYAMESTTADTSDPSELAGALTSGVNIKINFGFTDGTFAYSETDTVNRDKMSKEAMVRFIKANQNNVAPADTTIDDVRGNVIGTSSVLPSAAALPSATRIDGVSFPLSTYATNLNIGYVGSTALQMRIPTAGFPTNQFGWVIDVVQNLGANNETVLSTLIIPINMFRLAGGSVSAESIYYILRLGNTAAQWIFATMTTRTGTTQNRIQFQGAGTTVPANCRIRISEAVIGRGPKGEKGDAGEGADVPAPTYQTIPSAVNVPVGATAGSFGDWREVKRYTATKDEHVLLISDLTARASWASVDGADRAGVEYRCRLLSSAGTQKRILNDEIVYIRNGNGAFAFSREASIELASVCQMDKDDYVIYEARGVAQKDTAGKSIDFDPAKQFFTIQELTGVAITTDGGDTPSTGGGVSETPRRLDALPTSVPDGDEVYITADYSHERGVTIVPNLVGQTQLDGNNVGDYAWWNREDAGFQFGQVYPALPDDFVAISDTRVYVKRGTQTNLASITIGSTEYALTRVPQPVGTKIVSAPDLASSQPDIDYYTIGGTGLPDPTASTNNWKDVRFKTTGGAFVPATVTVEKGLYRGVGGAYQPADFEAPQADIASNFKVQVEEEQAGLAKNENITFIAGSNIFSRANPFDGIERIAYHTDATQPSTNGRYTVWVPLADFDDSQAPTVLRVGSNDYPMSYLETGSGHAVYRSALIPAGDAVTTSALTKAINIQKQDGQWLGHEGLVRKLRTIEKEDIAALANTIKSIHTLPTNPIAGQRFRALNDITLPGRAVLRAATSVNGAAVGFSSGNPALGSLVPTENDVAGLLSYADSTLNSASLRDKTFYVVSGAGRAPSSVIVNRDTYQVTQEGAGLRHFYRFGGADGHVFVDGREYAVQVNYTDGTKLVPDVAIKAGDIILWTGDRYVKEASEEQVDPYADFNLKRQVFLTETEYQALTRVDPNVLYFTT